MSAPQQKLSLEIGSDAWIEYKFRTIGTSPAVNRMPPRDRGLLGADPDKPDWLPEGRTASTTPGLVPTPKRPSSKPGLAGVRPESRRGRASSGGGGDAWALLGISSAEAAEPGHVEFSGLWKHYPSAKPYVDTATGKPPKGYENQCAIKVSMALQGLGVDLKSFKGATVLIDGKRAAIRAAELSNWLGGAAIPGLGKPEIITGPDWEEKVRNRKGIIAFDNYWARPGESSTRSGDHIDLWNGSRLTASGLGGSLVTLGRYLGVESMSIPGTPLQYSDLGQSTRILFYEVK